MKILFSGLIDLFLYKSIVEFVTGPTGIVAVLFLVGLLLWLSGIFVQFRNGVLSYLLYLLLLSGCMMLLFQSINIADEDLKLSEPSWVEIVAVSENGLVSKASRFRDGKTYPLLCVTPVKNIDSLPIDLTGRVRIQTSEKYPGVVAYTANGINIGSYLLSSGFGVTTEAAPVSYYSLEQAAKKNRLGIWQYTVTASSDRNMIFLWLILLSEVGGCVCLLRKQAR